MKSIIRKIILASILSIHTCLLVWGAAKHSPNLNEPAHLIAGLSHWKLNEFGLYRVNPPLVRLIASLPVLFSEAKCELPSLKDIHGRQRVFIEGRKFVKLNGNKSIWYFTLARWACIPLSILGGLICYFWARDLYGEIAGILSLTLWCFSPNILGHAQFITPACGATSLGIASAYFFSKWLRSPEWILAILAGLFLGFVELTKSTWVILFLLWPLIWSLAAILRRSKGGTPIKKQVVQLVGMMLIGLYVLNLGYGFQGTFTLLKDFHFLSNFLTKENNNRNELNTNRFSDSWIGLLPVPLPQNYVIGIDHQKRDFEDFGRESYLRGKFQHKGWWYYYLYAISIKVPIGYFIIFGLAITRTFYCYKINEPVCSDALVLSMTPIVILLLVSSQTGFNHHMRYILPAFPFGFILMGQSALWISKKNIFASFLLSLSLLWSIGNSLFYFPHSLSYFNEFVGGPKNGHHHLINSNIDWGQDLLFLRDWINSHPEARPFSLCYYGGISPEDLGIKFPLPELNEKQLTNFKPQPGWYAISVNYLKGYGWRQAKNGFTYFQNYEPVGRAGYSIYIYHIEY